LKAVVSLAGIHVDAKSIRARRQRLDALEIQDQDSRAGRADEGENGSHADALAVAPPSPAAYLLRAPFAYALTALRIQAYPSATIIPAPMPVCYGARQS